MTCDNFQVLEPGQGTATATDFTPAEITFPYDNIEDLRVDIYDYGDNVWRNIPRNAGLVANVDSNNPATSTANDFYSWETYTDINGRIGVRTVLATAITTPPLPAGRTAKHPYAPNTGAQFPIANNAGANVRVYRQTAIDAGDMPAIFYPGSAIKAEDLNANFEALRRVVEEGACGGTGSGGDPNAQLDARYWNKTTADTISSGDAWTSDDNHIATTQAGDARWLSSGGNNVVGGSGITVDQNTPAAGQVTVRTDGDQVDIGTVRFGGAANTVYTFPVADGQANQVLQTDGSATLSWVNQTAGQALTFRGSVDCTVDTDIPGVVGHDYPNAIVAGDVFTVETTVAQANVTANWQTAINGAATGVTSGDLLIASAASAQQTAADFAANGPDVRLDRIQTGGNADLQAVCTVGNTTNTNIIIDNQQSLQLKEADANGNNHTAIRSAAAMAADVTWTLPAAGPANADELVLSASGTGANVQFQWVAGGGGSIDIGDNAPAAAAAGNAGDLWWNSDDGRLYISYTDADTSQWVDASPSALNQSDRIQQNNTSVRITDTGANGTVTTNIDGTNRIVSNTAGTTFDHNVTATSYNGGQLAGFRNKLINGSMEYWQRLDNPATGSTASGWTAADQWYSLLAAGGSIARSTTVPPGFAYSAAIHVNAGNADGIIQPIELRRTGDAGEFEPNSVWTLSYYATQQLSLNAIFRDTTENAANSVAAGAGFTNHRIVENNVGSGFNRYACDFVVPAAAAVAGTNKVLTIWLTRTGGGFNVTGIQLEPGNRPTPFEHRAISTELALCKRYFQWVPFNHNFYAFYASQSSESGFTLPVEMARQPTVTTLTGDPLTTQGNSNNASNQFQRLTARGGSMAMIAQNAGAACYAIGYRAAWNASL